MTVDEMIKTVKDLCKCYDEWGPNYCDDCKNCKHALNKKKRNHVIPF